MLGTHAEPPPDPGTRRRWWAGGDGLPGDPVSPFARLVLPGFDLHPVLLARGRDEPAHAVRLPPHGGHDFGQRRPLRPTDHRQNLRSLARYSLTTDCFRPGFRLPRSDTANSITTSPCLPVRRVDAGYKGKGEYVAVKRNNSELPCRTLLALPYLALRPPSFRSAALNETAKTRAKIPTRLSR